MKKFSWILALLAALTMVFVGVGCGGGDDGPVDVADLVIDDADEIGDLLIAKNYYGSIEGGDDAPVVKTDKNKAIFDIGASFSPDNNGFYFSFPEGVEKGHKFLEVTFKLVSVTTLSNKGNADGNNSGNTGGTAKIGFKANAGEDLKPYDDYEIVFGVKEDEGVEKTQIFPLSMLNKDQFTFNHNKYNGGSIAPVKYTIEITKVKFYSGADVKVSVLDIGTTITPATGGTPVTTIDEAQFTGAIAWTPAVAAGAKFAASTEYTADIVLTAKPGFTLAGLTDDEEFTVKGTSDVTYKAATKTVTAVFAATGAALADFEDEDPEATIGGSDTAKASNTDGVIEILDASATSLIVTYALDSTWAGYKTITITFDVTDIEASKFAKLTLKNGSWADVQPDGANSQYFNWDSGDGDAEDETIVIPVTAIPSGSTAIGFQLGQTSDDAPLGTFKFQVKSIAYSLE